MPTSAATAGPASSRTKRRALAPFLAAAHFVPLAVLALPGGVFLHHEIATTAATQQPLRVHLLRERTERPVQFVRARTVAGLVAVFDKAAFTLPKVGQGKPVPRLFVKAVPVDIRHIKQTHVKKSVFIRAVLPLVLRVNEDILRQRARLQRLAGRPAANLSTTDRAWLAGLAKKHGLKTVSIPALLTRVDIVPPSLAIAQAIVESGWGTSLAARRGNSLFGQMSYGKGARGIAIMQGRVRARIAGFDSLLAATRAYVQNLNSHPAYAAFRQSRARLRTGRQRISGHVLAGSLLRYSELGIRYVRYIQGAIRIERLGRFDAAVLKS